MTPEATCQILKKGEVQVGEKERDHDIASLRKELATLVAEKCVDPSTQRPYPVGMIEKAMTEAGYSVKTNKTAKSQVGMVQLFCGPGLTLDSGLRVHKAASNIVESADTTCPDAGEGHYADKGWQAIAGTDTRGS
jgi:ribosome maturation protein SDO1